MFRSLYRLTEAEYGNCVQYGPGETACLGEISSGQGPLIEGSFGCVQGCTIGCESCTGGTYSLAGSRDCSSCVGGTFSNAGAASCASCGSGTYSEPASSVCIKCDAGTYQDQNGQSECYNW